MTQKKENLRELLDGLYDKTRAGEVHRDIVRAQFLLNPEETPGPAPELLDSIKTRVAARLDHGRPMGFMAVILRTAVAAAAAVIVMFVSVRTIENGSVRHKVLPAVAWDSEEALNSDSDNILIAEIEDAEFQLLSLKLSENEIDEDWQAEEIEAELIELNNSFWKG